MVAREDTASIKLLKNRQKRPVIRKEHILCSSIIQNAPNYLSRIESILIHINKP